MTGLADDRYLAEILGQPAAFRRAAQAMAAQDDTLRALAARGHRGPIVLTGMGSSYDACLAAAAALGAAGILAATVETAELLHIRRPMVGGAGLLVLVSQSGRSAEAVRLADEVRRLDARRRPVVLAITNGAATPVAAFADLVLDTEVGAEVCPSTITFAGSLVALATVAALLDGSTVEAAIADVGAAAAMAATAAAELLGEPGETGTRLAAWLGARPTIVALGRGTGLAAAEMIALTLMEAAGVAAAALPTAEFRHGPLEIVGPDVAVILFALEPSTEALDRAFAGELAAAGSAVLLVGPAGPAPPGVASIDVPGPRGILAPAVSLGPLQLLARRLAYARGRRPESFSHASKVTTRE
jgi:glucosamine--fructose-6-phosphate aminotransferase (isomerizing)